MSHDSEEVKYRRLVLGKLDRFGYVAEAERFLNWCNSRDIEDPFVFDDKKFDCLVNEWRAVAPKENHK